MEWLVVAVGVEGELAQEFAGVGVDDTDVEVGDEGEDALAAMFAAEADVAESAVVAQGHHPAVVDLVAADAVVHRDRGLGRGGFRSRLVGLGGGAAGDAAVGSDGVVVAAEPVELAL